MTPPTPAMQAALLTALDDNPNASKTLRSLWVACNLVCCRCGRLVKLSEASREHIVPRAKGGDHAPTNLRLAHERCNAAAGDEPLTGPLPDAPVGVTAGKHNGRWRNSLHKLRPLYGDVCWLCGQHMEPDQMTRSRVVVPGRDKGFSIGNLRLVHKSCQDARVAVNNAWAKRLERSRARTARQRLVHRRRAVILRRQHRVLPRRNTWTKICAIVRSLFSRLCPSRRTHEPRPGTRHPRPSRR